MKSQLKKLLKQLKLLEVIQKQRKKIYKSRIKNKYINKNKHEINISNKQIYFNTSDEYSKNWFYPRYDGGKLHEPAVSQLFIENLNSTDCVLDLGAHLGYFTCLAAAICTRGTVHSFEIDPKCIPLINKNIEINSFTNITLNNKAVSNQVGKEKIPILSNPISTLSIRPTDSSTQLMDISSTTIDTYVNQHQLNPNFIKIDVEGAEYKVLQGMQVLLKKNNLKLLIEVHTEILKSFNTQYSQVIDILIDNNFQIQELIAHRKSKLSLRKIERSSILTGNTMIFAKKGQIIA